MRHVFQVRHVIPLALIGLVLTLHQPHRAGDEQTEHDDDPVNRQLRLEQRGVGAGHDQDRNIFVEVLYRDGMSGAHQDMASMLQ